jgi:hypothetical protein
MESIIKDDMLKHLFSKNLITQNQNGFLKNHLTQSQLLKCLLNWRRIVESKKACHVVYIDFKKVYDYVSYDKLLIKLAGLFSKLDKVISFQLYSSC